MGAMLPGTYHATVQVSSATPGVAPVSISVTLEIRPLQSSMLRITLATVGQGGAGNGRLTATGIDCVLTDGVQGGDCEESYAPGTVVHVTVLPAPGQEFYYTQGCWLPGPCGPTGFDIAMSGLSELRGRLWRTCEQDPRPDRLGWPAERGGGVRHGAIWTVVRVLERAV